MGVWGLEALRYVPGEGLCVACKGLEVFRVGGSVARQVAGVIQ